MSPPNGTNVTATGHGIIVIGGSSGSLLPLVKVLADLPEGLPAALFVVLHGARGSQFSSELLTKHSRLEVADLRDGTAPQPGTLYVAPQDRHLLFEAGKVRIVRGPRENSARPSIDVLFRSAAVEFGSRVIAVLLSGSLNDGVAGLLAVKRCGGETIVQHPDDASFPELPKNAVDASAAAHVVTAAEMGQIVERLVATKAKPSEEAPEDLQIEARHAAMKMQDTAEVTRVGEPTQLTCPECGGPITQISGKNGETLTRYRCEIGHAFTQDAFLDEQAHTLEQALWIAFRTLKERSDLVRKMAEDAQRRGFDASATRYREVIDDLEEHAQVIKNVLERGTQSLRQPS